MASGRATGADVAKYSDYDSQDNIGNMGHSGQGKSQHAVFRSGDGPLSVRARPSSVTVTAGPRGQVKVPGERTRYV
jgi:hypothetical protein